MFQHSLGFSHIVKCPRTIINALTETELTSKEQDDVLFFPVDNACDNKTDKVFQHLMIQMFKVISESDYVKEKISFEYFEVLCKIEKKYSKVNVEGKNKVLEFIRNNISSDNISVKTILQFFIDIRRLIHFLVHHRDLIFVVFVFVVVVVFS